jgi:hypothetical protein
MRGKRTSVLGECAKVVNLLLPRKDRMLDAGKSKRHDPLIQ